MHLSLKVSNNLRIPMSNKTVPLTEVYSAYTQPLEPQILEEIPKKKWAAITALVLSLIAFFTGILVRLVLYLQFSRSYLPVSPLDR